MPSPLRLLQIALAVAFLIVAVRPSTRTRLGGWVKNRFKILRWGLLAGFVVFGTLFKTIQYWNLEFSGQDFWLFTDMLHSMSQGGFFFTRFAPQAIGWVQHGVVHPMASFAVLVPLVWAAGPVAAAILFHPLALALAALALDRIARTRLDPLRRLILITAFLGSTQIARVFRYEIHPEILYPLAAALWYASFGCIPAMIASGLFLMGIKEDAILIALPLLLASFCTEKRLTPRQAGMGLGILAAGLGLQMTLVSYLAHFTEWNGVHALVPTGSELTHGLVWKGPATAWTLTQLLVRDAGGMSGIAQHALTFLFSKPFLSLLVLFLPLAISPFFWIAALPVSVVMAQFTDPSRFINYYAAPLLGVFWISVARARRSPRWAWVALGVLALALGGDSLDGRWMTSPETRQTIAAAQALAPCIPAQGQGIVSSRLIRFVSLSQLRSDRLGQDLDAVDFYFLSPGLPSFEIDASSLSARIASLRRDPKWNQIDASGKDCRVVSAALQTTSESAVLFVKSSRNPP